MAQWIEILSYESIIAPTYVCLGELDKSYCSGFGEKAGVEAKSRGFIVQPS